MEFLGLFWFVGVFLRLSSDGFMEGCLKVTNFRKAASPCKRSDFSPSGLNRSGRSNVFFPMGFPGLESRRNEGFPDRSKRSVLSLRRSLSYVLFLSKGALPRRLVRRVCPSRLSKFLPSSLNSFVSAVENLVFPVFALQSSVHQVYFYRGFQPYFIEAFFMVTDDPCIVPFEKHALNGCLSIRTVRTNRSMRYVLRKGIGDENALFGRSGLVSLYRHDFEIDVFGYPALFYVFVAMSSARGEMSEPYMRWVNSCS